MDDAQPNRERAHRAKVRGSVHMLAATVASVAANSMKKGDVLGTARFAALQAARDSASWVPPAPTVRVAATSVDFRLGEDSIDIEVSLEGDDQLGATMAAFSAVTAAALTIYDMCKSADRTMVIGPVTLVNDSPVAITSSDPNVDDSAPGP